MDAPRHRIVEFACNTGCFLLALRKGQFRKLPFFAHHAFRAFT